MIDPIVLEKLQKILALASDRAATQGEIESAMTRAKEIAIKHGIDLASIPARENSRVKVTMEVETNVSLKTSTRYVHPYHHRVLQTLEEVFEVRIIRSVGRIGSHSYFYKLWVVGEPLDVALACAMFPWLESMFPKAFGREVSAGRLRRCFPHMNGFYLGLYRGIAENNQRQQAEIAEADRSKWALVVANKEDLIQKAVAQQFPSLKKSKGHRSYNSEAHELGKEKGKTINLKQVSTPCSECPSLR